MSWLDRFGGQVDEWVVGSRRLRGAPDARIEEMPPAERIERLRALLPSYADPALLRFPGGLLTRGAVPVLTRGPIRRTPHGPLSDLSWTPESVPFDAEVGPTFEAHPGNRETTARWFGGERAGPTLIAIHGYGAGNPPFERLLWPLRSWRAQGWDVVFPTLPFHGPRAEPGRRFSPRFPAADPRFTHEGFRRAVVELVGLIDAMRAAGAGPIGLVGMSLGGYVSALLATLLEDLHFLGLVIPLASIADFAHAQGRLGSGPDSLALRDMLEAVYLPSSPFARPPKVAPARVCVLAARADRVTGVAHAERLADHFGIEPILCDGSHLIQLGLRWRALDPLLA